MPSETHRTMTPGLPYRCIAAPRAHPEWVGQIRLAEDWPRSTTAQYEALLLGEYIRHLREAEGMTRRTVAVRCRVGLTTVRDWEIRGKIPRNIVRLTLALGREEPAATTRLIIIGSLRKMELDGRAAARDWEREHVYRM